jgi:hypothetical protein
MRNIFAMFHSLLKILYSIWEKTLVRLSFYLRLPRLISIYNLIVRSRA